MSDLTHVESFTHALRRMGAMYARIAAAQSAEAGSYSKQDLMALDVLGTDGPMSMGSLADALGIGQSAVTPIVDRLEKHGWVQRARSEADRRVWLIGLTEEGRRVFAEEDVVRQKAVRAMLAPLGEEERATLVALLEKITRSSDVSA